MFTKSGSAVIGVDLISGVRPVSVLFDVGSASGIDKKNSADRVLSVSALVMKIELSSPRQLW